MRTGLFLSCFVLILMATACAGRPSTPTPPQAPAQFSDSGRVSLGDIITYYEVHGVGKALILLHGGLGGTDDWTNQVPAFSQSYRVIALDNRGRSRSTDGEESFSYHLMAEDTLRLMDYLSIDAACIVGWSDGGIIALDLAIHHPERVIALVAYGAHISPDGHQEQVVASIRESATEDFIIDEHRRLSPQPERLPLIIEKLRTMWLTQPAFTAEELAGITVPTLVIDGEKEEVVRPEQAATIAAAIPGAELILLPDVGHFAPLEKSAAWNDAVLDFLKDR